MTHTFDSHKTFIAITVAFILHNIEEAATICLYPFQSPVSLMEQASCSQFLWAVSIVTAIVLLVSTYAIRTKNTDVFHFISTAVAAVLLFNVFVPHVFLALYYFRYTPGLFSAVIINLPLCIFQLIQNKRHYTKLRQMFIPSIVGLAVGYILLFAIMGLARLIIYTSNGVNSDIPGSGFRVQGSEFQTCTNMVNHCFTCF